MPTTNSYWLTSVTSQPDVEADDAIRTLIGQKRIYAFSDKNLTAKHIQVGDWICFYLARTGIVADAKVLSDPERTERGHPHHLAKYPWLIHLDEVSLYLDRPMRIDESVRRQLDAFKGRRTKSDKWGWLVQGPRRLSAHDFNLLTATAQEPEHQG